jgi:Ca2+-binding EF-hand superfamily protein
VGGALDDKGTLTDFADDELNLDSGIGFHAELNSLSLVTLKDNGGSPTDATDDKSYLGLELSGFSAALVGIDGLTVSVTEVSVKVNQATDTDGIATSNPPKLDWRTFLDNTEGLEIASLNIAASVDLEARGNLLLEVGDFVQIRGGFAFTRSTDRMVTVVSTTTTGTTTTTKNVQVVTIGMHDVNVFAGAGPYFADSDGVDNDGDLAIDELGEIDPDAIGLLLKDVTVAIALFKPTDRADTSSYYAIRAEAEAIELPGLDLGSSESFSLTASGYRVEVNGGKNGANPDAKTAINFAALPGGSLAVATGPDSSLVIDYVSPMLRVAIERATLIIDEYVYISGGFAFTKLDALPVKLSNGQDRTMSAYGFGAGNVDLFVGDGPYFIAGSNARDPDAVGLAIENVNFGLLLMRPTEAAYKSIKYTALRATANFAGLVGIDVFKLSASGIAVEFNSVDNPSDPNDTVVVDFRTSFPDSDGAGDDVAGYNLDTGNGELEFSYDSKLLRATIAVAELQISEYVFIKGSLAFEQGPERLITLSNGSTKTVTSINIGAENLTIFVGVNGPYWTDLDRDNIIDTGETNPDAIGLAINDADLALALLRPKLEGDPIRYVGLKASAQHLGFVGTDVFQFDASSVVVELNLATGDGTDASTPVVNFDASSGLFAIFDVDRNGSISVAELDAALNYDHGATAPLTTAEQLITLLTIANAPPLSLSEVIDMLENSFKTTDSPLEPGTLTNLQRIQNLDRDLDGNLDAAGYEVLTGGAFAFLTSKHRQIHASADDVLLNIANFVYVKANVAIDLGSRELVTIKTGIPSSLGAIGAEAVTAINNALNQLSTTLVGLEADIKDAITSAINLVKEEINSQVDSIIATIRAELQSALGDAVEAVTNSVKTQLESVTQSLSVDSLIDPLLDQIKNQVPEGPLRDLLGLLLKPVKEQLAAQFKETLDGALTGAVDSIAASVGGALQAGLNSALDQVEAKIREVINPVIAKVVLALEGLVARVDALIAPIFARLHSIANIDIGENFGTLENVLVDVTTIGISEAYAFVGIPPDGGFDFDQDPITDQSAIGLFVENLNMALGIFQSPVAAQLPRFIAAKIDADSAGFIGLDVLEITAQGIHVELNLGGPIVSGAGALFQPATIDFLESFGPQGYAVQTGTTSAPIHLDFEGGELIVAVVEVATIRISEFVHITGSVAFEKGRVHMVDVTGGLLTDAARGILDGILDGIELPEGMSIDDLSIPALGATQTELTFMTIGASNVHAFVGIDGPYWVSDVDGNRTISWAVDTGTLTSRNITAGSATIGTQTYGVGDTLPDGLIISLGENDGWLEVDGKTFGDRNGDLVVDVGETQELNGDAKGLVLDDLDFGLAMMKPTLPLDFSQYFALKATADQVALVGIDGVTIKAQRILVEINQSTPSIYGIPLFPVVDWESTFDDDERRALFDILDANGDHNLTANELNAALNYAYQGETLTTVDQLVDLLDVGGAPPDILLVDEVLGQLNDTFKNAIAPTQSLTNLQRILNADADGDEKFDPIGFELNTGGTPVYLSMGSPLIRAQGFVELAILDNVFLTGSVAFELGPTQVVTLSNGDVKEVTTMTIGAANVTAFIGVDGPYWTDFDGDHSVDEATELSPDAIGFHITDFDVGIMVMASVDITDLGIYLAAKASVFEFGIVGVDFLEVAGRFDLALNIGIGATSGFAVVDFDASFNEQLALFDTNDDGKITVGELRALSGQNAFGSLYAAGDADMDEVALTDIASALDTNDDQFLQVLEAQAFLSAAHDAAARTADKDGDDHLDYGFEVNTGDPDSPVVLDFDGFLISFQLGGSLTVYTDSARTNPVLRMNGLLLFEADDIGLKVFVAAGLEFGPDIGKDNKFFEMSALGGLVINAQGIAADIDVSIEIGAALGDLSFDAGAKARLVFNTTGVDQEISIPERYVGFLNGTIDLSNLEQPEGSTADLQALSGLTGELDDNRFVPQSDGSVIFVISGTAPEMAELFPDEDLPVSEEPIFEPGPYFAVAVSAKLMIGGDWGLQGRFALIITGDAFQLSFEAKIELGPFGQSRITGDLLIDDGAVVALVTFTLDAGFGGGVGLQFIAGATLELNTGEEPVVLPGRPSEAVQPGFKLHITGTVIFLGFARATGSATITIAQGSFELEFDITFAIGDIVIVARGGAGVYTDIASTTINEAGVALLLTIEVDANIFEIIKIKAGGKFMLNTSDVTQTLSGVTLGANSFRLELDGEVKFLEVLTFDAEFTIHIGAGEDLRVGSGVTLNFLDLVEGEWYVDFSASMDFFGLAMLGVSGWFSSRGHFDLHVEGEIVLGSRSFGMVGEFDFHVFLNEVPNQQPTIYRFGISASAGVSVRAFGISFGSVDIDFSLTAQGAGRVPLIAEANASIKILFVRIRVHMEFTLGYIELPKPVFLAGNQANGTVWTQGLHDGGDGVLYLNMGARNSIRGIGEGATNESYIVEHAFNPEFPLGESVKVIFSGRETIFHGVTKIVADAGSGSDHILIREGVLVPVELRGGAGNDVLLHEGNGHADLWGDDGIDYIEVGLAGTTANLRGGDDEDYLVHNGAGAALLDGGLGADTLRGGPLGDTLIGDDGSDDIDGRGGLDVIDAGDDDDIIRWTIAGDVFRTVLNPNGTLTDEFLWTVAEATLPAVQAGDGHDVLIVTATAGDDVLWITPGSNAVTVTRTTGGTPSAAITVASVTDLVIDAGTGADTVTVPYLAGSNVVRVTIDAGKHITLLGTTTLVDDQDSDIVAQNLDVNGIQDLQQSLLPAAIVTALNNVNLNGEDDDEDGQVDEADEWTFTPTGATVAEVTANQKWRITDTQGRVLFIERDQIANVLNIRTGNKTKIEVRDRIIANDGATDVISVDGSMLADDVNLFSKDVVGNRVTSVGILLRDDSGELVTDFTVTNGVRGTAEVDRLILRTFGGNDSIDASGMGDADPNDGIAFPDMLALEVYAWSGDDTIVGTPFNDLIDSGTGSDTVTGGTGFDQFFDASPSAFNNVDDDGDGIVDEADENEIDTLVETQDLDMALFNDKFITGVIWNSGSDTPLAAGLGLQSEIELENIVKSQDDPDLTPADPGDRFSPVDVTVEDIKHIFERANIRGGTGNNTIVVNDIDGTVFVGAQALSVSPWQGRVTLDSRANESLDAEHYIITIPLGNRGRIEIVDSVSASVDVLIINGTTGEDNIALNAAGSGSFRVGQVVASEVSNTLIIYRNVERVFINTLGGDDRVLSNDTVVPTIINLGSGNDELVVGTVPLIPDTGNRTLEFPDGVPVADTQNMTNGNSATLFVMGEGGDDRMEVNHNRAKLFLHGGSGDDRFLLRTFLVLRENPENPDEITNLANLFGGTGFNRYDYLQNAPVFINGGPGIDTIVVVGTPIGDIFVITDKYIAGAGRIVTFTNVEAIEVDGGGGPDEFYVLATSGAFETTIVGGSGDDTIHIGGDHPPLIFDPPAFTYVPPAIEVALPPELVFDVVPLDFSRFRLDVHIVDWIQAGGLFDPLGAANRLVARYFENFERTWKRFIPLFEVDAPTFSSVQARARYGFFGFIFDPTVELTVFDLQVEHRFGRYEERTQLIQPAPITVDPAPFAFKAPRSLDVSSILGRLTIVGGEQFEDAGDRVIVHNQEGPSAPGQLTTREITRAETDENGDPIVDMFLSLEGAGLGIPDFATGGKETLDPNDGDQRFYGVELDGIENVEVRLGGGDDTFTFDDVPEGTRVTLASGGGVDTIHVHKVGGETRILTGAGDDFVTVNAGGSLANIAGRLFIDGDAHIEERQIPFTEDNFGADVIAFVPDVFVDTNPFEADGVTLRAGTFEFNGTFYRLPSLAPVVDKIPGNANKELRVRVVVLDATGAVQEDFIQAMGVPEFGKQKLLGPDPLWFDDEGRETTNALITGVPVIITVDADDPDALPVWVDAASHKRFETSTLADDDDIDNDGDTLTDEPGERAENFRSFITDFENGSLLYVTTTGALTEKLPSVLVYNNNGAAPDFNLYELDGLNEFDEITVQASVDGDVWLSVVDKPTVRIEGDGSAGFVRSYDLGSLSFARFIRVTGHGAEGTNEFDGFDLDALGVHPGQEGGEGDVFAQAIKQPGGNTSGG